MGRKFKGFPKMAWQSCPRTQRLSYLRAYAVRGKNGFDYDPVSRRAAFESFKVRHLPPIDTQKCFVCDKLPEGWHHIIYISSGGWDTPQNIVPLCRSCYKKVSRLDPCRSNRKKAQVVENKVLAPPKNLVVYIPPKTTQKLF